MTKGPHRQVLDQYLDTAAEGRLTGAGFNWKQKASDLEKLSEALTSAAQQAELRIGEQTLTGPALRAGMEESATSLALKAEQLRAAGEALTQVGRQLSDARDARDALAALGDKPPAYQAPAGTPGVEPTDEEIAAQAAASQARQNERTAWQTEYDKQEAKALALTKDMDAAFIGAIPPMKEIHGEKDPTEPPPGVPSGPGGPYLPGTQAPPPTGGGGGGNDGEPRVFVQPDPKDPAPKEPEPRDPEPRQPDPDLVVCTLSPPEHDVRTPIPPPPTTTVIGTSQDGITYQPSGPTVSTPVSATSAGPSAAALGAAGAAGGAGALASGSVRGAAPAGTRSATPVRAIGATGRAGSAGALSRSAGSSASSAAPRSTGAAGSPASRSAAGAGGATGRGAATGSSSGRGGAGGRGAAAGSTAGQRAGGRGSAGARSAGAAGSGARGGRKGDRDRTTDRDSLVYDQDWLGDDDVAPGVLD